MTRRNGSLSLAAVLALFAMISCQKGTVTNSETTIQASVLAERIDSGRAPLILDVRSSQEFDEGHIPGAIHIPHTELATRLGELPARKDAEIVVYCRSGRRAGHAEEVLVAAGFTGVKDLTGHMQGWESGGPSHRVIVSPDSLKPARSLPRM